MCIRDRSYTKDRKSRNPLSQKRKRKYLRKWLQLSTTALIVTIKNRTNHLPQPFKPRRSGGSAVYADSHLIWFLAPGYYQLMWSRKTDVIGSCDLCYRAATAIKSEAATHKNSSPIPPPVTKTSQLRQTSSSTFPLTPCRSYGCLLYTSPSPRDRTRSRMPSSA